MDQILSLRVFTHIAETRHFSRTAAALSIPRATVSKAIQELEAHLGIALFRRTTRHVAITPEGAGYLVRAKRLLTELGDMDSSAARAHTELRGRLRVDLGSSLANFILLPALPAFCRAHPELEVILGISDRMADLVSEGVDCVLRGGPMEDSALRSKKLCDFALVTVASRAYLATHPRPRSVDALRTGHTLVGYYVNTRGRSLPLRFKLGRKELTVEISGPGSLHIGESTGHLSALVSGLGVGQTLEFSARPHLARGELVPLLEDWTHARYPIHAVYPPARQQSAKLRAFLAFVTGILAPYNRGA